MRRVGAPPCPPVPRPAAEQLASCLFDPQVVVLDKLDYCATLNNLSSIKNNLNFKVSAAASWSAPLPRCTA